MNPNFKFGGLQTETNSRPPADTFAGRIVNPHDESGDVVLSDFQSAQNSSIPLPGSSLDTSVGHNLSQDVPVISIPSPVETEGITSIIIPQSISTPRTPELKSFSSPGNPLQLSRADVSTPQTLANVSGDSTPAPIQNPDDFVMNLRQQMATDWKVSSEYYLHILFTKFIRYAENKLNACLEYPVTMEPPIVEILGEGYDPSFDKVIESLGHIAKKKPKPVIDAMMFWRKTKSEAATLAAEELEKLLKEYEAESLLSTNSLKNTSNSVNRSRSELKTTNIFSHKKSNSSKSSISSKSSSLNQKSKDLEALVSIARTKAFQADRKSLISIYLLCRVLIEIVKQAPEDVDEDLDEKLEEIIYNQLKNTDPMSISTSIIKSSNWNTLAELLGYMSDKNFVSVNDRFIADLEKIPNIVPPEEESSVHLLILGMRYLRLKNYPLEKFEEGAEFMMSISKFFAKTQNLSISLAFAELTNQLLLPLAGTLSAEVNHPIWVQAMNSLFDTATKIQSENKFWASGFKLKASILCVMPSELFIKNWMNLIESNINKIKSKNLMDRIVFAVGVSRLVWVYVYRCTETLNNTTRTLMKLLTSFVSSKKKLNWITPDLELISRLSDVLVSIGYTYPNFMMENALLPLIRQSFNGISLENINYEKLILAIITYRGLLTTKETPEFLENESRFYELDLNNIDTEKNEALLMNHEEVSSLFYKLFLLLDSTIGSEVWSPENRHSKNTTSNFGSFSFNFGDNEGNSTRNLNIVLFATLIETMPCCLCISKTLSFKSTIEIFARNAVHSEVLIAASCQNALKALASRKNPYTLITWFAKYSFDFDEKTQSNYSHSYLTSEEYKTLLVLYVELLDCWLEEFQTASNEEIKKDIGLDGIELVQLDGLQEQNQTEKLEWKNIITVIEEVEGNGLFFLCSFDYSVRRLGIQILKIISKFDEAMTEKAVKLTTGHSRTPSTPFAADRGTRLIDLLNDCNVLSLLNSCGNTLSVVEKTRLLKHHSKSKSGLLVKLIESEHGVDAALWQRIFPKLLSVIFKMCPITMALCRSIVCIRLVQIHELILKVVNKQDTGSPDGFSEAIVNQWKLYLIAACSSLTSTADQKLHIPDTMQKKHGRKQSQQIFTVQHQKIKSAKSIFKMVLPLLNSGNASVKDAIKTGLSSMNVNIFRAYLESVDEMLVSWKEDSTQNQARVEMFHVLTIASSFLKEPIVLDDEWILKRVSEFIKHAKRFLELKSVQTSFRYQPLRSYFAALLGKYYNAIKEHPLADHLFPFEARTSCFNYLKEWCGYGDYVQNVEESYNIMVRNAVTEREKTTITTALEFQKPRMQMLVLEAMVALCSDPIVKLIPGDNNVPIIISFDTGGLMSWIESLFNSQNERVRKLGVTALENLLAKNKENEKLFKDVSIQCVSQRNSSSVSVLYYTTLCKSVLKLDNLILDEDELVSLGLYGLISDKEDIRIYAVDLLSVVETKLHDSSYTKVFKERLTSSSKSIYKSTAIEVSTIFAELLSPDLCLRIFSSLVRILELFGYETKRDLLILMKPWLNKFILKSIDDVDTHMILTNLFYITIDLNNDLPKEVEELWIALGKGNSFLNIHVCLEYIIYSCIGYANSEFVVQARDVVLYLTNVPGGICLLDNLMDLLEPKAIVPTSKRQFTEPPDLHSRYSFVGNISNRLKHNEKSVVFSKTQLSIIFLENLLSNPTESIKNRLPTLLHVCVCLLDHYIPLVQKCASKLIRNLVFGLVPTHAKSEEVVEFLRSKNQLWSYDNLVKDKKGAQSPKTMDLLVRNILSVFFEEEDFQTSWQRIALKWATLCPLRHVACRSFQIFRSLLSFLDEDMLRDMLHRLSNTISDSNPDIQGFSMQILMTLNAIMAELDATKLITFPQLFWSITACLSSIHEQEFVEVLSCLAKFISKIDLDSPDTVQCLIATFPSNWEGKFEGLQRIIMTGLRSSNSSELTWKLLDKLNNFNDSEIIADTESRLLFAFIANLPRLMNALDTKDFNSIEPAVKSLIFLADNYQQPALSRLVDSLHKNKFRSKKDFISQAVGFIARNYFPKYSAETLVFFMGLLLNKSTWMKVQTMAILKYVFPLIDLKRPEFIGVGADLISPLLRLLLTRHETEALEVLDCVSNIPGSKMDREVLRISMGSKDPKNSEVITTTLFGIPDESGWSIPMPLLTATTTRHNVHSVFLSFTIESSDNTSIDNVNDMETVLEFDADVDYHLGTLDTEDSNSISEERDVSLSHMWAELDNLDSFFAKESENSQDSRKLHLLQAHDRKSSVDTTTTEQASVIDSAPQLYDKKVSVILNQSLSRTPSNVSFKTSLADSFAATRSQERTKDSDYFKNRVSSSPGFYANDIIPHRGRGSSYVLKSPSHSVLGVVSSARSRTLESPQDSLFRFEDFVRNPHKNHRRRRRAPR